MARLNAFIASLRQMAAEAVERVAKAEEAAMQQDLSVPVGRDFSGNAVVRSKRGESPRYDTGELYHNVDGRLTEQTSDGATATVSVSRPSTPEVPRELEYEMGRPFFTKSYDRVDSKVYTPMIVDTLKKAQ